MSQQQFTPQLNYYSRFSRRKRTPNELNSSFSTYRSKLTTSSLERRRKQQHQFVHASGSNKKRSSRQEEMDKEEEKEGEGEEVEIGGKIRHEGGGWEQQQSVNVRQDQSEEPQDNGGSKGKDSGSETFAKQQSLANKISDFSIPPEVINYNLNQSDYYISKRFFQFGNESISSIQQGESLYIERVGLGERRLGNKDNSITINQDYSNTTEDEHRLIVFNDYRSREGSEQKLDFDVFKKQSTNAGNKKKNFKSLFKNRQPVGEIKSASKGLEKNQDEEHRQVKIDSPRQLLKASYRQKMDQSHNQFSEEFYGPQNTVQHSDPQPGLQYSISTIQNRKLLLSQSDQQPFNLDQPNQEIPADESLFPQSSLHQSHLKKSRTIDSKSNSKPIKDSHHASQIQDHNLSHSSANLRKHHHSQKQPSSQSILTLEDKLERIYQLNFGSPKKQREVGGKRSRGDGKQEVEGVVKPKVVEFVEVNFEEEGQEMERREQTDEIDNGIEPESIHTANQNKHSINDHQKHSTHSQHPTEPYSPTLHKIQSLLLFITQLQQPKRESYSPLISKLYKNTLHARKQFDIQRQKQSEALQQLALMFELKNQCLSWKRYLPILLGAKDPERLEIVNNCVIIESLVKQLSGVVGDEFGVEGGSNY